jgi:hypothetical protein
MLAILVVFRGSFCFSRIRRHEKIKSLPAESNPFLLLAKEQASFPTSSYSWLRAVPVAFANLIMAYSISLRSHSNDVFVIWSNCDYKDVARAASLTDVQTLQWSTANLTLPVLQRTDHNIVACLSVANENVTLRQRQLSGVSA